MATKRNAKQEQPPEAAPERTLLDIMARKPVEVPITDGAKLIVRPATTGELAAIPAELTSGLFAEANAGPIRMRALAYALEHFCTGEGLPCEPAELPYEAVAGVSDDILNYAGLFRCSVDSVRYESEVATVRARPAPEPAG